MYMLCCGKVEIWLFGSKQQGTCFGVASEGNAACVRPLLSKMGNVLSFVFIWDIQQLMFLMWVLNINVSGMAKNEECLKYSVCHPVSIGY